MRKDAVSAAEPVVNVRVAESPEMDNFPPAHV
jgi:hypothetical protein